VFLPPLVYESAYGMDARQLLRNLPPILLLAVPVLLVSTAITAGALLLGGGRAEGLGVTSALLFGALISATDPVAVVALFKDLGAPSRLGTLVEGESLCNDGTAIVLFNILLALLVAPPAADASLAPVILGGIGTFFVVSLGGVAVGCTLSWATFTLIGRVVDDERVEISLSVVLAYGSFLLAEHFLHVSGVIAAVSAGLVAGSYGRTKISPPVNAFMQEFWHYLAFAMNALIFFFVGVVIARQVPLEGFVELLPLLAVTLGGVIAARALGVFGGLATLGRSVETIDMPYKAVMFWGGLRGAVSLALALTIFAHPELPIELRRTVLVLAAGVVLFTLLVNAMTMQPLIEGLGLAAPSALDRFATVLAELERVQAVERVIARLDGEGAVLPSVLEGMRRDAAARRTAAQETLSALRKDIAAQPGGSAAVAASLALSVEKSEIMTRFRHSDLTEAAAKSLLYDADALLDRIRAGGELPRERHVTIGGGAPEARILSWLEGLPGVGRFARAVRARRLGEDLEATRGLFLVTHSVVSTLTEVYSEMDPVEHEDLKQVRQRYRAWKLAAGRRLHTLTSEFPDYARSSQRILANLQALRREARCLEQLGEEGLLTKKCLSDARDEIRERERGLRTTHAQEIELEPEALLRRVPIFSDLGDEVCAAIAQELVSRTYLEGETVVDEGAAGESAFLIARGLVAVSARGPDGEEHALATIDQGGFFGEMALVLGGSRSATVRALTPVNLLELSREKLEQVLADYPQVAERVRGSALERSVGRAMLDAAPFGSLSVEQRANLAGGFVAEEHAAGTVVSERGQPERLLYVSRGELRVGDELLPEGSLTGWGGLSSQTYPDHATAASDLRLLVLPSGAWDDFAARNPATADAVLQAVDAGSPTSQA